MIQRNKRPTSPSLARFLDEDELRPPGLRDTPSVSVVMAVFNGVRYLADAVESILSQSYSDFEFIVINDGSTDGSGDVLDRFASQDPRVHVVHQENRGLPVSLNRGIALARGRYVARMDADDVSEPERLATQVFALDRSPGSVLATGDVIKIDATGAIKGHSKHDTDVELTGWHLLFFNCIGVHGQVMLRREAALAVGGYDESLATAQDHDLWCRLWPRGSFLFLPDALYQYRLHNESVSRVRLEEQTESSIHTSLRHIFRTVGISFELDQMRKLWTFWAERRSRVAVKLLTTVDAVELDGYLRQIYSAYLGTHEGQALTRKQRARIRASISWRYMRWARRRLDHCGDRRVAGLMFRAARWSPSACVMAIARFGRQKAG